MSTLFSKSVWNMEIQFDMDAKLNAIFGCLKATHAQDLLFAIPIDGLGQNMSPIEYCLILMYRLVIPLFPLMRFALFVVRHTSIPLESTYHCRKLLDYKYGHDFVRDVLLAIYRWTCVSVKK